MIRSTPPLTINIDLNADNQLVISSEKRTENSQPAGERVQEGEGALPAPRVLVQLVPAELLAARDDRARQDLGQNGEWRIEDRDSEKSQTAAEAKAKCIEIE